jgi:hypothetical protein
VCLKICCALLSFSNRSTEPLCGKSSQRADDGTRNVHFLHDDVADGDLTLSLLAVEHYSPRTPKDKMANLFQNQYTFSFPFPFSLV